MKRTLRGAAGRDRPRLQKYYRLNHREYPHTLPHFSRRKLPKPSKKPPPPSCRSRSQNSANMASDFEKLSKMEYYKWKKEDENWASFLAEIRTAILMTQRQTKTRAARTKELATSGQRDHLVNLMTTLEDLTDLEATAVITYVTALKVGPSPTSSRPSRPRRRPPRSMLPQQRHA